MNSDVKRGQNLEAEAKILASRLLWPRGLNITGDEDLQDS